jgi:REP element-mobilizing transposase RayT
VAHPHLIWNRPQHNYLSPIEVDIHASGRTLQSGVERKNILHRDKHTSKTNGYIVCTQNVMQIRMIQKLLVIWQ